MSLGFVACHKVVHIIVAWCPMANLVILVQAKCVVSVFSRVFLFQFQFLDLRLNVILNLNGVLVCLRLHLTCVSNCFFGMAVKCEIWEQGANVSESLNVYVSVTRM